MVNIGQCIIDVLYMSQKSADRLLQYSTIYKHSFTHITTIFTYSIVLPQLFVQLTYFSIVFLYNKWGIVQHFNLRLF